MVESPVPQAVMAASLAIAGCRAPVEESGDPPSSSIGLAIEGASSQNRYWVSYRRSADLGRETVQGPFFDSHEASLVLGEDGRWAGRGRFAFAEAGDVGLGLGAVEVSGGTGEDGDGWEARAGGQLWLPISLAVTFENVDREYLERRLTLYEVIVPLGRLGDGGSLRLGGWTADVAKASADTDDRGGFRGRLGLMGRDCEFSLSHDSVDGTRMEAAWGAGRRFVRLGWSWMRRGEGASAGMSCRF